MLMGSVYGVAVAAKLIAKLIIFFLRIQKW